MVDTTGATPKDVTFRDLRIRVPNTMPADSGSAAQIQGDTIEDVDIVSRNLGTNGSDGISSFTGGGTVRDVTFEPVNGGALDHAITTNAPNAGDVTIQNVTINDATEAIDPTAPGTNFHVDGAVVNNPGQLAFNASAGSLDIVNSVATISAPVSAISAAAPPSSANNSTVTADHVTAVYSGNDPSVPAIRSDVFGSGANQGTGNPDLRVTDSIFSGYGAGWVRSGGTGVGGSASLSFTYSNLPMTGSDTGNGLLQNGLGNISADPLFVAAGDYHLQPGSPSIDAADPTATAPLVDIAGSPRPRDGNGDGVAVSDQGAYEYQDNVPPETTIERGPGTKHQLSKGKAKFSFTASEGGATFACKFDDEQYQPCKSPQGARHLKKGKHTFSVVATDVSLNVDPTPATEKFKVKPKKKHHKHHSHGGHGHHGPKG